MFLCFFVACIAQRCIINMILKDYMAVVKSVSFKDSALSWLGNLGQVTEMFYDCVLLRILGLLCLLIIVSQDCCNKLPHVSGLKQHTLLSYSGRGRKSKISLTGLKSACLQGCAPTRGFAEESIPYF